jgi:threonine dehydrogenase-like Zn-dependent dehydrogenase
MNKNLSINAGNCNHRAYIPKLVEMVRTGVIDPIKVLTKVQPMTDVIEAYMHFDKREAGWIKTELKPATAAEQRSNLGTPTSASTSVFPEF